MKNHKVAGSISGPVLAFLGVLVVGLGVAAFLFVPKFKEVLKQKAEDEIAATEDPSNESSPTTAEPESTPEPVAPKPVMVEPEGEKPSPYLTDSVLISDLTSKLQSGDIVGFLELSGEKIATPVNKQRLKSLIVDRKYIVDADRPQVELGSEGDAKSWGINLTPPAESKDLGAQQIKLGLANSPNLGWNLVSLAVPEFPRGEGTRQS